ncbi:sulfatase-like hydrolase/transferase [Candidatus Poribacteria bacterium]|nr:sulfatase-like hydrolase/transferase [Candidatus Poribacteria bacterium]
MLQNPKDKPNVVLILVDDLGYGDLACCGSDDMRTPNLDNMAASGVRFENFYANCPVCSPTRASVMTGRYPDMVGVPGVIRTHAMSNFGRLSQNAVMLPEALDKAGYNTAIIGKWHLGLEQPNTPNIRGFDHFNGFLGDMMDDYYTHRRHDINYMRLNEKEIDPEGHATDLFSDWACEYIKKQAGKENPFFMYLAYNAPHTPIQPPEEWFVKVRDREPGIDEKRAKLVALIEHMDYGIGKVLKALEESGQKENTLVIFTSDNGGQLNVGANNGPLNGGKGQMLEGGIKEPMFAVWPGHIEAGSHRKRVGLTMDLFPTICDAAGVDFSHEIDGFSILPDMLNAGKDEFDERMLFWVRREGGMQFGGQSFYAVRCGQWKLLQNTPFEPPRLYNLKEDPKEINPIGKEQDEYGMLFNEMQKHVIRTGAIPWQEYPVDL